jgi:hypothetical protein
MLTSLTILALCTLALGLVVLLCCCGSARVSVTLPT